MAKTKADLIEEAESRGIELEGTETVEELKTLLSEPDAPELSPVEVSAAKVRAAKEILDAAEADHKLVVAEYAEPEPVADPAKHVLVDVGATGVYNILDIPAHLLPELRGGPCRERVLVFPGVGSVEHVGDHPSGVWQYRRM